MSVRWLAFAVLLMVDGVFCLAAEPALPSVRVDVQIVALEPAKALPLLPTLRKEESADAALERLHELIRNGEANLLGWPVALAQNGRKALSQSSEEVRYPTEADMPSSFQDFSTSPRSQWKFPPWHANQLLRGADTPNAFEIRDTGPSLEFECGSEMTGERIALNLVVNYCEFLKFQEFRGSKDRNGGEGVIIQPEFIQCQYTGSLTLQNGKRVLVSNFFQKDPQPHVILFLVRATTMPGANQQFTK